MKKTYKLAIALLLTAALTVGLFASVVFAENDPSVSVELKDGKIAVSVKNAEDGAKTFVAAYAENGQMLWVKELDEANGTDAEGLYSVKAFLTDKDNLPLAADTLEPLFSYEANGETLFLYPGEELPAPPEGNDHIDLHLISDGPFESLEVPAGGKLVLDPGKSLTVNGDVTLGDGATLELRSEEEGANPASLTSTGGLTIGEGAKIELWKDTSADFAGALDNNGGEVRIGGQWEEGVFKGYEASLSASNILDDLSKIDEGEYYLPEQISSESITVGDRKSVTLNALTGHGRANVNSVTVGEDSTLTIKEGVDLGISDSFSNNGDVYAFGGVNTDQQNFSGDGTLYQTRCQADVGWKLNERSPHIFNWTKEEDGEKAKLTEEDRQRLEGDPNVLNGYEILAKYDIFTGAIENCYEPLTEANLKAWLTGAAVYAFGADAVPQAVTDFIGGIDVYEDILFANTLHVEEDGNKWFECQFDQIVDAFCAMLPKEADETRQFVLEHYLRGENEYYDTVNDSENTDFENRKFVYDLTVCVYDSVDSYGGHITFRNCQFDGNITVVLKKDIDNYDVNLENCTFAEGRGIQVINDEFVSHGDNVGVNLHGLNDTLIILGEESSATFPGCTDIGVRYERVDDDNSDFKYELFGENLLLKNGGFDGWLSLGGGSSASAEGEYSVRRLENNGALTVKGALTVQDLHNNAGAWYNDGREESCQGNITVEDGGSIILNGFGENHCWIKNERDDPRISTTELNSVFTVEAGGELIVAPDATFRNTGALTVEGCMTLRDGSYETEENGDLKLEQDEDGNYYVPTHGARFENEYNTNADTETFGGHKAEISGSLSVGQFGCVSNRGFLNLTGKAVLLDGESIVHGYVDDGVLVPGEWNDERKENGWVDVSSGSRLENEGQIVVSGKLTGGDLSFVSNNGRINVPSGKMDLWSLEENSRMWYDEGAGKVTENEAMLFVSQGGEVYIRGDMSTHCYFAEEDPGMQEHLDEAEHWHLYSQVIIKDNSLLQIEPGAVLRNSGHIAVEGKLILADGWATQGEDGSYVFINEWNDPCLNCVGVNLENELSGVIEVSGTLTAGKFSYIRSENEITVTGAFEMKDADVVETGYVDYDEGGCSYYTSEWDDERGGDGWREFTDGANVENYGSFTVKGEMTVGEGTNFNNRCTYFDLSPLNGGLIVGEGGKVTVNGNLESHPEPAEPGEPIYNNPLIQIAEGGSIISNGSVHSSGFFTIEGSFTGNLRIAGSADISGNYIAGAGRLELSDRCGSTLDIGANTLYIPDWCGEVGTNITAAESGRVIVENNDRVSITINDETLGSPHVFGGNGSYGIFFPIYNSLESVTVEQGHWNDEQQECDSWTELAFVQSLLDEDGDESPDKLHLEREEGKIWITDPWQVRVTVTVDGGTVIFANVCNHAEGGGDEPGDRPISVGEAIDAIKQEFGVAVTSGQSNDNELHYGEAKALLLQVYTVLKDTEAVALPDSVKLTEDNNEEFDSEKPVTQDNAWDLLYRLRCVLYGANSEEALLAKLESGESQILIPGDMTLSVGNTATVKSGTTLIIDGTFEVRGELEVEEGGRIQCNGELAFMPTSSLVLPEGNCYSGEGMVYVLSEEDGKGGFVTASDKAVLDLLNMDSVYNGAVIQTTDGFSAAAAADYDTLIIKGDNDYALTDDLELRMLALRGGQLSVGSGCSLTVTDILVIGDGSQIILEDGSELDLGSLGFAAQGSTVRKCGNPTITLPENEDVRNSLYIAREFGEGTTTDDLIAALNEEELTDVILWADLTLDKDMEIPGDKFFTLRGTLTVPDSCTLNIHGGFAFDGGKLVNEGSVIFSGDSMVVDFAENQSIDGMIEGIGTFEIPFTEGESGELMDPRSPVLIGILEDETLNKTRSATIFSDAGLDAVIEDGEYISLCVFGDVTLAEGESLTLNFLLFGADSFTVEQGAALTVNGMTMIDANGSRGFASSINVAGSLVLNGGLLTISSFHDEKFHPAQVYVLNGGTVNAAGLAWGGGSGADGSKANICIDSTAENPAASSAVTFAGDTIPDFVTMSRVFYEEGLTLEVFIAAVTDTKLNEVILQVPLILTQDLTIPSGMTVELQNELTFAPGVTVTNEENIICNEEMGWVINKPDL